MLCDHKLPISEIMNLKITLLISILTSFQISFLPTVCQSHEDSLLFINQNASPPSIILQGLTIHPTDPFHMDFLIDSGGENTSQSRFQDETLKQIKYFMAALAIPENHMWVNLSPYENNRIMSDVLSQTQMGRDMLAQDYMLKQISSTLMSPDHEIGDQFWDKLYQATVEEYNSQQVPVEMFNKIWIVPESANIHVHGQNALIMSSRLKVMLEEDYLAISLRHRGTDHGLGQVKETDLEPMDVSLETIREVIIPAIEKEVNEGPMFANLRQIYHALILATWYKENLNDSYLGQTYCNQSNINSIAISDPDANQEIYNQYVQAFQSGVLDVVREEYQSKSQQLIKRRYLIGGVNITDVPLIEPPQVALVPFAGHVRSISQLELVGVDMDNGFMKFILRKGEVYPKIKNNVTVNYNIATLNYTIPDIKVNDQEILIGNINVGDNGPLAIPSRTRINQETLINGDGMKTMIGWVDLKLKHGRPILEEMIMNAQAYQNDPNQALEFVINVYKNNSSENSHYVEILIFQDGIDDKHWSILKQNFIQTQNNFDFLNERALRRENGLLHNGGAGLGALALLFELGLEFQVEYLKQPDSFVTKLTLQLDHSQLDMSSFGNVGGVDFNTHALNLKKNDHQMQYPKWSEDYSLPVDYNNLSPKIKYSFTLSPRKVQSMIGLNSNF